MKTLWKSTRAVNMSSIFIQFWPDQHFKPLSNPVTIQCICIKSEWTVLKMCTSDWLVFLAFFFFVFFFVFFFLWKMWIWMSFITYLVVQFSTIIIYWSFHFNCICWTSWTKAIFNSSMAEFAFPFHIFKRFPNSNEQKLKKIIGPLVAFLLKKLQKKR